MAKYWIIRIRKIETGDLRLVARMLGVFFRDLGVLVVVFGILDKLVKDDKVPPLWMYNCLGLGAGGLLLGILFGLWGDER